MTFRHVRRVILVTTTCAMLTTAAWAQQNEPPAGGPLLELRSAIDALQARIAALEMSAHMRALSVDCTKGERIGDALAHTTATARHVTIFVSGLCRERVIISRDDITLRGVSPGAGIEGPPDQPALRLNRAQRIALHQLTISGGRGIEAEGSTFVANGLFASGSSRDGLLVVGGAALLTNVVVDTPANRGVVVVGGLLTVTGADTLITNAPKSGLAAEHGSSLTLSSGATVARNAGSGIASSSSHLVITGGAIVEDNHGDGVGVRDGSTLSLSAGASIRNNSGHGVTIRDTSVAALGGSDLPLPEIVNNGFVGLKCAPGPAVAQIAGGQALVTGNGVGQIDCVFSPGFGGGGLDR